MLNTYAKNIKLVAGFILTTILLLFILLYLRNSTTLVVTMETPNHISAHSKIYFTLGQEGFSEKYSKQPFRVKKDNYYFDFSDFTHIKKLRFDPDTKKTKITIKEMRIITYKWLEKKTYLVPLNHFKTLSQIKDFNITSQGISLTSTGNDPNIQTVFRAKEIAISTQFPVYNFSLSILLMSIMYYLYKIYKTSVLNDILIAKLILYILFFSFIFFKVIYYKETVKFGYPPDELMHFKYIKYIHTHHNIVPEFKNMPHYLSHPSLYYELIDFAHDTSESAKQNIEHFRSLSALIFMATIMLIFYLGFTTKLSILGHFVYLSFISSIPMHAYLGASISNDTLAMFGGIIFILGLKRLIEENYHTFTYFIIGLGIFLAFFSKLTAALLLFFAIVFFLLYMIRTKKWIKLRMVHIAILMVFILPILYYQLSIIMEYHALIPTYNHTHPEAYLKSGFYTPEAQRIHLTPYQWLERMIHYIQGGWFGIHSHHSFVHNNWSGVAGLLFLHSMALITLFMYCPKENKTFCLIGKMSLLALFSVLIVQYFFSYKAHLNNGYLGGLQPRYLLPFMFSFAIMASLFAERFKKIFIINIIIILVCIHALYSDFFYFLKYYA